MKKLDLKGFNVFSAPQGMLIVGLTLDVLARVGGVAALVAFAGTVALCSLWSLYRLYAERKLWNGGVSPNGELWVYYCPTLFSRGYRNGWGPGAQMIFLTHFHPEETRVTLLS